MSPKIGFFRKLALGCMKRVFTGDVKKTCGNLPEIHTHGMPILAQKQNLIPVVHRSNRNGTGHVDNIPR